MRLLPIPAQPSICPFCSSEKTEWREASGKGEVYSHSTMRRVPEPYALAYVTLYRPALVREATLNPKGEAVIPIGRLHRLRRELRYEPQPSLTWMSVS